MGSLVSKEDGPEQAASAQSKRAAKRVRKSGKQDRRALQRRKQGRGDSQGGTGFPGYISDSYWLLAPVMAISAVLAALGEFNVPSVSVISALVVAIGLISAVRFMGRFSERWCEDSPVGLTYLAVFVAVPMATFGAGMAQWADEGGIDWRIAIAALLGVTGVGSILQSRRQHTFLCVQLAAWAPLALIEGSMPALIGLACALMLGIFVGRRQLIVDEEERQFAAQQDRINRRAGELLRDFEEMGQGWFWEADRRGTLTYVSPIVAMSLDRPIDELLHRPFSDLFDLSDSGQEGERTLAFHLSSRSAFQELAVRADVNESDEARWWSISGRPAYDAYGNFVGFRGYGHDLTEKRRSQEQASRLAHFDSLTGLANRHQMSQTLEKILSAPQERARACAVFLLDLDRFKQVNDTLGHPAGDWLLKQVAQRLERVVDAAGRVGRLGGDEFQVILPGRIERNVLSELAQKIIETLSQPYSIEGHRVVIGASVGIAVSPEDGDTSEALIRNSDLALYAAKDGGRGRFHFYAEDLHMEAEDRRQLEHDLRDAIHNGGLELHYQPVVHAATEQISGFEALLRWNHPKRGPLSPAKYIGLAEDTGLISVIGEWALRTACQDLAKWPESVRVAVNVSPLQFANPRLPAILRTAIAQAGIRPDRLELEITETVYLNTDENTQAMFSALKKVGVRLALDDFGTGYSSLAYLQHAPFDKIKIDQSFVRGATQPESRNGAIISAITSLADALGMETTAEGVETLDELDLVRLLGCSHVQGYIYDKALTCEEICVKLRSGLQAVAKGPRAARAPRQKVLRKVVLEHSGQFYNGTVRNISSHGAMIEGLWNVPTGTIFTICLSDQFSVVATARWCSDDRMGVEFSEPLARDGAGNIIALSGHSPEPIMAPIKRAS